MLQNIQPIPMEARQKLGGGLFLLRRRLLRLISAPGCNHWITYSLTNCLAYNDWRWAGDLAMRTVTTY